MQRIDQDKEKQPAPPSKPYFSWKKLITGVACGVATWFSAYYIGIALCTFEGYREGTKYGGRSGGAYGALFGFLAGLCIVGPTLSTVGAIAGTWLGYTRGPAVVQTLWTQTYNALASLGGYVKNILPSKVPSIGGIFSKIAPFIRMATNAIVGKKVVTPEMLQVDLESKSKQTQSAIPAEEQDVSDLFLNKQKVEAAARSKQTQEREASMRENLDIDPETGASRSSQLRISMQDAKERGQQRPQGGTTRGMFDRFGTVEDPADNFDLPSPRKADPPSTPKAKESSERQSVQSVGFLSEQKVKPAEKEHPSIVDRIKSAFKGRSY
jgi:hypothetical protein